MNLPLLSIVVPTKNRYKTLLVLIETLMTWDNDLFELVIHDNSDDNAYYLENIGSVSQDNRLKYFYIKEPLSAIQNCDLAIGKASGEYVCFIGDDDGVVSQIVEVCKWMKHKSIDAIYCRKASYTWPDMTHSYSINNKSNGILRNISGSGNTYKLDIEEELKKLMDSGGQSMFNMPRLYHGIVSRKVLDEMFLSLGSYFPGSVPDMANTVGMAAFIKSAYYVDLSVVISGHSRSSMSGKNANREHQGELTKEKSLPEDVLNNWNERIPRYWSAPTIWADAAFRANTNDKFQYLKKNFNYSKMYANCFAFTSYWKRTFVSMKSGVTILGYWKQLIKCLFYYLLIMGERIIIFIRKLIFGIKGVSCRDIKEAIAHVDQQFKEQKVIESFLN